MGTRSIVGLKTGKGWFGRYVHWDGYPSGVGAAVWHIARRDGLAKATSTLLTENFSWSTLTAQKEPNTEEFGYDPECFVKGYGYKHADANFDDIITDDGDKWGTEWAYIISREGLRIYKVNWENETNELITVGWGDTKTAIDWTFIDSIGVAA